MTRRNYYASGAGISVGERQRLTALRRMERVPCPQNGCQAYEKGWDIEANMADPADANVARYIREGKTRRRYSEEILAPGAVRFHFLAGQPCLGHRADWNDPVYIVGERKTTRDEWHTRLSEGSETLVAANKRLKEMED